jgi:hypothetical protein
MTLTLNISTKELERQAALCFEGYTYKVFLVQNVNSYTAEDTAALWEADELTSTGYAAVTGTLATGSYEANNARYEIPQIQATFTAGTGGMSYSSICLKLGTETYLHSVITETPTITLLEGQSKTYTIQLAQDD